MCKNITIFPMLLSEFETEYMPILNALTDPSIIIDGKMPGEIVLSNKSAEQLFLYTEQELSKINLINLLTEKSREMYLKDLELYEKNSITIKFNDVKHDYYGKTKNGEEFLLDLSLSQIMIDNKIYLLTVLRDLNKLKLREELSGSKSIELVVQKTILNSEKQYLNQQENFVNALCHELCNPITGIYSGVQTLKDSLELLQQASLSIEEQQILFQDIGIKLEMIAKCVEQEKRIVDDVLTVSKLENGTESLNLIAFELTEIIGNFSKMFITQIKEKRLELKLEIPKNPVWLKGDPHQISKVLISLMSNAIKFTEYGAITVVVITEPSFVAQENVVIEFVVKDTGIGMLKEDMSNLFQTFEQKKINTGKEYSGSGLGLLISKKTIELMGGTIKIESQKWEGTQVYFSIKCSYLNEQELFEAIVMSRDI